MATVGPVSAPAEQAPREQPTASDHQQSRGGLCVPSAAWSSPHCGLHQRESPGGCGESPGPSSACCGVVLDHVPHRAVSFRLDLGGRRPCSLLMWQRPPREAATPGRGLTPSRAGVPASVRSVSVTLGAGCLPGPTWAEDGRTPPAPAPTLSGPCAIARGASFPGSSWDARPSAVPLCVSCPLLPWSAFTVPDLLVSRPFHTYCSLANLLGTGVSILSHPQR